MKATLMRTSAFILLGAFCLASACSAAACSAATLAAILVVAAPAADVLVPFGTGNVSDWSCRAETWPSCGRGADRVGRADVTVSAHTRFTTELRGLESGVLGNAELVSSLRCAMRCTQ